MDSNSLTRTFKRASFCVWLSIFLPPIPLFAQTISYDELVVAEFAKGESPGIAVAIIENGEVVYSKGIGLADIKKKTVVTPSTRFMIGSVTKQFTAMAVMMLAEQGVIDVDEKVRMYLPELTPAYDAVTIRHLLTHTSGIKSDFKKRSQKPFYNESMLGGELYKALAETDLEFNPGDEIRYSNTGYSLLYTVIETVSKERYQDFLMSRIFAPLEMHNTTSIDHENSRIQGLATGYGMEKKKFRNVDPVLRFGGGSLVSTVEDLARWDAALNSERLVSREILEQMWTPQILKSGVVASMGKDKHGRHYESGMGWFIGDDMGRGLVHHSGGIDGYASNIDRYGDANLTIIVLCNIENDTAVSLSDALAKHYFAQD